MSLAPLVPLLLALGCAEEDDHEFDYVLSHEAFELGDISRTDFEFPTASVSLLNLRNDSLRVTLIEVTGPGSGMVEPASSADFSTIAAGASITMEVAVTHDRARWDSGAFEPALVVQLGRLVDASSDWNDPDEWVHAEIEIPIRFSIQCDVDGDGVDAIECAGEDCDDSEIDAAPAVSEHCDGIDNDCDGRVDLDASDEVTLFADEDGDGWGDVNETLVTCGSESGWVSTPGDCDDRYPTINPDAAEVCDGVDQDCDGEVDEGTLSTLYADADGDGFGDANVTFEACEPGPGVVADATDCDDADLARYPGALEEPNGADDDCDEWTDEDFTEVGGLIITEVMVDGPLGTAGLQWFEVTNVSAEPLSLDGWRFRVTGSAGESSFFVSPDAAVTLEAGSLALFCQDADAVLAAAPGVVCDYEFATADNGFGDSRWGSDQLLGLALDATAGAIRIELDATTVDVVAWDLAAAWPLVSGTSFALDPSRADATSNDDPAAWCAAGLAYSADGLSLGSPGQVNPRCPSAGG